MSNSDQDRELEVWAANRKAEWLWKLFRVSVSFEREEAASVSSGLAVTRVV